MKKKIVVALNKSSIQNAIKELNGIKKIIPKMQQEFLQEVAIWVINRANFYIDNSDIGENVKTDIRGGWKYQFITNGIKVVNSSDKAVFVEFGVGALGQDAPHPKSSEEGYEYNVPSIYKYAGEHHDKDTWRFAVENREDVDLSDGDFEVWHRKSGDLKIITRGSKGAWYAYNAIVDANMELAKPNGGEIGKMWNAVKARYIK